MRTPNNNHLTCNKWGVVEVCTIAEELPTKIGVVGTNCLTPFEAVATIKRSSDGGLHVTTLFVEGEQTG